MSVLLQISDAHFGTEQPPVVAALRALARQEKPEVVVWSGDITQRARRWQFEAARRFADELPAAHQLVIPGNHDIPLFNLPARIFDPYGGFRRAFGPVLSPWLSTPRWLVIGVNTTRPWRHKHGEVSASQVAQVAEQLRQAAPGQWRVVVVHQPLGILVDKDRRNLLRGHARAEQQWAAAGVDVVLGGHIHLPYVVERPVGDDDGKTRTFWIAQAGTAVSHRVRSGIANSVNLIRQGQAQASVLLERWDFDAATSAFERVSTVEMPRAHR